MKKDPGRSAAFELSAVSDGFFWIDGGAMFGAVPKVLWSRSVRPDRKNRVRLALNCLLVRCASGLVLVDTGIGSRFSAKVARLYRMEHEEDLVSSLARLDVRPEDIGYVINTHLHFDHCGGNTTKAGSACVPAFPNARYVVQRQEWHNASNPDQRTRSSYRSSDFKPLEEGGRVMFVDGDTEIVPGIKVLLTNGHTLGHQSVLITGPAGTAFYPGDVMPTAYHLKPHYLTAFDEYPVDLVSRKKELLDRAVQEEWLIIFEHDPDVVFARLGEKDGKRSLEPWDSGRRNACL